MYNLIEYAPNRTVSDFIRYTGAVEEEFARFFMCQILHAIQFMHHQGYAHLDIKLENILLDAYYNIKVADLGSATYIKESHGFTDLKRGTKFYLPPEVDSLTEGETYDGYSADVYTLGITLFLLLTGEFPSNKGMEESDESTTTSEEFVETKVNSVLDSHIKSKWKSLSPEVKNLLQYMIHPQPFERPTISQLIESDWFNTPFEESICADVFDEMEARKNYMTKHFGKSYE